MSGSQRNEWNSYLNGGTSQYNFSYNNKIHSQEINPTPVSGIQQTTQLQHSNNINNRPPPIYEPISKNKSRVKSGGKRKQYSKKTIRK
jgi:hypothetical protein